MRHTGLGNTLVVFFPVALGIISIVIFLVFRHR